MVNRAVLRTHSTLIFYFDPVSGKNEAVDNSAVGNAVDNKVAGSNSLVEGSNEMEDGNAMEGSNVTEVGSVTEVGNNAAGTVEIGSVGYASSGEEH